MIRVSKYRKFACKIYDDDGRPIIRLEDPNPKKLENKIRRVFKKII